METYISYVVISLVLVGLHFLFRKAMPIDKAEHRSDKPYSELRKKYMKVDLKQVGVFLLLSIVLGFAFYFVYAALINFKLKFVTDALVLVKPEPITYVLLAMFSSMLAAGIATDALTKRQLKTDWEEFLAYSNLKYRFNYVKISKYTLRFFALLTALMVIVFADWYTAFGEEGIQFNGLLSLGTKKYSYSDVVKIKDIEKLKAPNGDIVEDPHYVIEFKDGNNWNSRDNGFGDYDDRDSEIIDLVCDKTDLEPEEMEFDEED